MIEELCNSLPGCETIIYSLTWTHGAVTVNYFILLTLHHSGKGIRVVTSDSDESPHINLIWALLDASRNVCPKMRVGLDETRIGTRRTCRAIPAIHKIHVWRNLHITCMTCSAIVTRTGANAIRRCQDHKRRVRQRRWCTGRACIATTGTTLQKETGWMDVQYNHQRRSPVQSLPSYRVRRWPLPRPS